MPFLLASSSPGNPIALFALTLTGAFALYLLGRLRKQPQFSVLAALNVKAGSKASPGVIIFDAILTATLGALLSYFSVEPMTNPQAIAAGLAFTGVLNSTGIGIKHE